MGFLGNITAPVCRRGLSGADWAVEYLLDHEKAELETVLLWEPKAYNVNSGIWICRKWRVICPLISRKLSFYEQNPDLILFKEAPLK